MITPTNSSGPLTPLPLPAGPRAGTAGPATLQDAFQTDDAQWLQSALARTPAIRPEVVERGARLAVDPAYPPLEIINEVAALLARSRDPSEFPE